jgi:hypothetical protein
LIKSRFLNVKGDRKAAFSIVGYIDRPILLKYYLIEQLSGNGCPAGIRQQYCLMNRNIQRWKAAVLAVCIW